MTFALQEILDLSEPASPPPPWSFLEPVSSLRQLPEPERLHHSLTKRFSNDQLVGAGVLVPDQSGELELAPVLAGPARQALFLQTEDEVLFDIVNLKGSVVSKDPPAFSASLDMSSRNRNGEPRRVLVAFGEADLAVLQMLQLACAPAAGLEKLSGQQARRLLADPDNAQAGGRSQEQLAPVTAAGFQLVLVAWQLAKLAVQYPEALPAVISRLLNAEEILELDSSESISVWYPKSDEQSRIRAAFEFGEAALVRQQMSVSINSSTHSVREFYLRTLPKNPVGYAVARRELRELLNNRERVASTSSMRTKLKEFESEFEHSVVDAAIEDAMTTTDPIERSLKLMAAELMNQWHERDRMKMWARDHINGRYHPPDLSVSPDEFDERLRLVDRFVKIHQVLHKSKQPAARLASQ
jgi:hypothetical protein